MILFYTLLWKYTKSHSKTSSITDAGDLHKCKFYYCYKMNRTAGSKRRNRLERHNLYSNTHEQNHRRDMSKVDGIYWNLVNLLMSREVTCFLLASFERRKMRERFPHLHCLPQVCVECFLNTCLFSLLWPNNLTSDAPWPTPRIFWLGWWTVQCGRAALAPFSVHSIMLYRTLLRL